jgi:hypothetical protein
MKSIDWTAITGSLLEQGFATTPQLLSPEECRTLIAQYPNEAKFRSTITMERFNFGKGEYRYFSYPLPAVVQNLREELYPRLSGAANIWCERLGMKQRYPSGLDDFLRECKRRNQVRPTPLMLKYEEGDFNCLHQDLYGDLFFPFQAVFGLSKPGEDYSGGELVLVKQRPRMQSIPRVIDLPQGRGVIFCVNFHPEQGKRGWFRTVIKHGVSEITKGKRVTLGIIFHDAR